MHFQYTYSSKVSLCVTSLHGYIVRLNIFLLTSPSCLWLSFVNCLMSGPHASWLYTYLVMATPPMCMILFIMYQFCSLSVLILFSSYLMKSIPIAAGKQLKNLRRENQKSALVAGLILALAVVMYILFANPSWVICCCHTAPVLDYITLHSIDQEHIYMFV